jgi:hypothetical protein
MMFNLPTSVKNLFGIPTGNSLDFRILHFDVLLVVVAEYLGDLIAFSW